MKLFGLFSLLSIIVLFSWLALGENFQATWNAEFLTQKFSEIRSWAWLLGIGLLLADLLLPLPGTVVMSVLGAVYGVVLGGLFAVIGMMLAGLLGYGIGRFFPETFVRRWLGDRQFERGLKVFERCGPWLIAMSRALPILPEVLACMAGLLRMSFSKFVVSLACGSVPMGYLFAAIGALGSDHPHWALAFSLALPAAFWGIALWVQRYKKI